ncbi:Concanavalin A-like lectin/glucanases superfamily protein [Neorhodopirellula lusitana]|uniref:Concanavalin A-like lectin/glucanases superfamily protein n=1 Tax=Neorhodopirellula lusitana TaxID=445327 RepID=A0ABY1QTZ0_9BACT|nr:LamG-like jellyroll fold domain-containing protein [Neorhodopirellula lusitana]SMP78832.1 Concanavalin A-like lectin/glucanases superfamily protein [Neorhodopirellula lusitana]
MNEELFDRYLNGTLDPEELRKMEDWINEDPDNARQFLQWSATHLDTRAVLEAEELQELTLQSCPVQIESQPVELKKSAGRSFGPLLRGTATAACLAILVSGGYFLGRIRPQDLMSSGAVAVKTKELDEIRKSSGATIVQRIDCVMQQEKWSFGNLNRFEPGQSIRVSEGVVVVEFDCGAQVTLQGPADMEVVSADRGFLRNGRLTAFVPPVAVGFEIQTPRGRVIDHGTQFGITVDEDGASETHVFDGEVEMVQSVVGRSHQREEPSNRTPPGRKLTENMAVRVSADSSETNELIPANPKEFILLPVRSAESVNNTETTTDLPEKEDLLAWFEASQGVQLDDDSRIISWQNLAVLDRASANNESVPNSAAWQVDSRFRPSWKTSAIANRPAIEFGGWDGREFLATTPFQTGDEVTVLMVCQYGDFKDDPNYSQLMTLGSSTKLILERKNASNFASVAWWYSADGGGQFSSVKLQSDYNMPNDVAHVCAVRYSLPSDTYEIFVNGQIQSRDNAVGSLASNDSYIIGCHRDRNDHFFRGEIAEIVLYDHMLSQSVLDQATETLMKKYGIETRMSQ